MSAKGGKPDFYKDVLDNLHDAVYFVDRERRITYWNRAAERITGYTAEEVMGRCCADNILMHVSEQGARLCLGMCPLAHSMQDGQLREETLYLHHKDGHRVPVAVRVAPIRDPHGTITGAAELFNDASQQLASLKRIEELEELALVCPLTKVGNRRHAETVLEARLDEFERYGWPCGVMLLDIDHFKQVNDQYGHDVGDAVLRMVARTVAGSLRSFDFVGRWGGEEFVVTAPNVTTATLKTLAQRTRALVETSQLSSGSSLLRVTVSIGGTLMAKDDTVASVVKRADTCLYRSKETGRNRVTIGGRSRGDPT
jgi:diguanylate cyclase (GGDEF)-like protein/PAS domain S-box-containing protein